MAMASELGENRSRARSSERRWAALDGASGLAVLAVVAAQLHVPGLAGGWVGLEMLLVIGGFSMTRWLLEAAPGDRRAAAFLVRRIALVVPAVVMAVLFALLWSYVQDGEFTPAVRGAALASVAQVYDVARVFTAVDGRAFTTMWAVSLEFQFSIVALVLVAALRHREARRVAGTVALLAFAVMVARMAVIGAGGDPAEVRLLPWFHLDALLLGAAAAFMARRLAVDDRQRLYRWTTPALGGLALAVVLVPAWWSSPVTGLVAVIPLVSVAGVVLVLAIVTRSAPAFVVRVLAWPGLRAVGKRSLGIYLWHHPIGIMLVAGGADRWHGIGMLARQVGLTAVVVLATYEFVERPVRAFLLRRTPTRP